MTMAPRAPSPTAQPSPRRLSPLFCRLAAPVAVIPGVLAVASAAMTVTYVTVLLAPFGSVVVYTTSWLLTEAVVVGARVVVESVVPPPTDTKTEVLMELVELGPVLEVVPVDVAAGVVEVVVCADGVVVDAPGVV